MFIRMKNKIINLTSKFLILIIRFYQIFISPLIGNNCRYHPTCSEYFIESLKIHGPIKGTILGVKEFLSVIPGRQSLIQCQEKKNNGKFSKIFFNVFNINFLLFLLIRWDPPNENSIENSISNDSERPLLNEPIDFEETTPFNENLSNIKAIDNVCVANNIKTLESPYWSLDIDLKKGEIVKTTLKTTQLKLIQKEKNSV